MVEIEQNRLLNFLNDVDEDCLDEQKCNLLMKTTFLLILLCAEKSNML